MTWCVILGLLVSGCSSGGPTDTGTPDPELPGAFPENRGQQLGISEITENVGIRWSGSTNLVYYTVAITQIITEIRSLRIPDGTTRVLHRGGNVGYTGYRRIEVSPDGLHVFAMLDKSQPNDVDLFDIDGTSSPILIVASPKSQAALQATGLQAILPSSDSRGLFYIADVDSLRFYDVATHISRRVGEGCVSPIVASPDGQSLLCAGRSGYGIMSMQTGTFRAITLPARGGLFWSVGGLEIVSVENSQVSIVNAATGESTVIVKPTQLRDFELVDDFNVARSADGKKIAFSGHRTTRLFGSTNESVLYVVDLGTLKLDHVAVLRAAAINEVFPAIRTIQFAPDGKTIAFVFGTPSGASVYLASVPQ
jgi:hypothetical protein